MNDDATNGENSTESIGSTAASAQAQNSGNFALGSALFLGAQLLGFLVCLGLIGAEPRGVGEKVVVPAVYGIFFGKVMLAAAATVLTRWNLLLRLTLPPFWLAAEVAIAITFDGPGALSERLVICGFVVFCWGVAQIPFWIYRWLTKARILTTEDAQRFDGHDGQFSIGQMLLFTLLVAVVLGVFRATLEFNDVRNLLDIELKGSFIFAAFLTSLALVGLLTIRAGLSSRPSALSLGLALAGVLGIMVFLYVLLQGLNLPGPPHFKFMLVNSVGGVAIWLAISVAALRLAGFRLI